MQLLLVVVGVEQVIKDVVLMQLVEEEVAVPLGVK
jgi:hypothetical protein